LKDSERYSCKALSFGIWMLYEVKSVDIASVWLHQLTSSSTIMGKLNIAHHKSYHPYRRDNIERVRRDEEEARLKEEDEEGRVMLAVRNEHHLDLGR
jgi:hypothetical protein